MTDPSAPHVPGPDADGNPNLPPEKPETSTSPNQPSNKPEGGGKSAPGREGPGVAPTGPELPADGGVATGTGAGAEPDPRILELTSLIVHLKADFDNYKKRATKEQSAAVRNGQLEAVKAFIPAFANLERALAASRTAGEGGALVDGVRAIHEQFQGILGQLGIERVSAVGQPFDPSLHDAVAATASPDVPPGTVTDEFEPGYRADGRALIPAKVRVSTAE